MRALVGPLVPSSTGTPNPSQMHRRDATASVVNMTTELGAPLGERVEFVSTAWIDEARRFLTKRVTPVADQLAGLRFTLAERYTNAPPHLEWPSDVAGFQVTIDDGRVDVVNGPPSATGDTIDLLIEGDYNATLPLAWTPFGGDRSIQYRANREYAQLAGFKAPTMTGDLASVDPTIGAVLGDLHDHLARRTVNNPDLDHRIEHYGLTANVKDLDNVGWTVLEGAFTTDFADELRDEINRNHDAQPADSGFRATMLLARGRFWVEAAIHPWVLTVAEHLLGRGFLMSQSDSIRKTTGQETHPGLHADYGAWMVQEPFPDICLEATAVWAIDDFTPEAGPTVLIPGSWRNRAMAPSDATRAGTTMVEMAKGSIAFWHGATWHGAAPRSAEGTRVSLHNSYTRNFVRAIERYEDLPPEIVARNPPPFSTLAGLDDLFGKSGYTGADFERMMYCRQAGYGQRV
jgi:hypothetical protein